VAPQLDHLFWSYRLAKFEVASERRGVGRLAFAGFEQNLHRELKGLAKRNGAGWGLFDGVDPGRVWVRPKSIVRPAVPDDGSSFVAVPERPHDHQIAAMTVRVLLEPSPHFATLEVVWLRAFGPALDSLLTQDCVGNRLELHDANGGIRRAGRRVYRYWAPAYSGFRAGAIQAAKTVLQESKGHCVLSALDLASYYDNIDARFLLDPVFVKQVRDSARQKGIPFARDEYVQATRSLLGAYARFRQKVGRQVGVHRAIGIPIGSLTARLVSNLALAELDRRIASVASVRFYARYVDDILVVEELGEVASAGGRRGVARILPLDANAGDDSEHVLDSRILGRAGSRFAVQHKKLRVFDLVGEPGLEYLDAVAAEMERVSSERRRFLEPEHGDLDRSVMASSDREPIRALRQADALSLRKLAVGTVCHKVSTAAAMLSRTEARRFSRRHLGKAGRLATDWSRWADLVDVAVRILGAALLAGDHRTANEVTRAIQTRVSSLELGDAPAFPIRWGSEVLRHDVARSQLGRWVDEVLLEAICSATPLSKAGFSVEGVEAVDRGLRRLGRAVGRKGLLAKAKVLAAADLRLVDRETDEAVGAPRVERATRVVKALRKELDGEAEFRRTEKSIAHFLAACGHVKDSIYSGLAPIDVLLMPRPPTYVDVLLRWNDARRPLGELAGVVNAVRGTRYQSVPMEERGREVVVSQVASADGTPLAVDRPRIVLGNLCTKDAWLSASLSQPRLSVERQRRLARVLNQAMEATRRADGRPTLLCLPELALPRRWVRQVCAHLSRFEPSLSMVTGLEYAVEGTRAYNEVLAFLPRPYSAAAVWKWTKRRPAHAERSALVKQGFRFATRGTKRRFVVLSSEHGRFIPLICSELLEVDSRSKLLGRVDLVLVPAWNKDATSFEFLAHSTALELHSFVAVANNGLYSDCRVRGPYSKAWRREVCRLISRSENEIVTADLPIGFLREYRENPKAYEQLREEGGSGRPRWKPMPPGMRPSFKRGASAKS
jgi:hypothetical protein